eukprot:s958_g7.t1
MAKLYFRYGAMMSAKTMNLLAIAHAYEMQSKKVLVMKPKLDTRFGSSWADVLITPETEFPTEMLIGVSCILVDEAQFLSPRVIERLRNVSAMQGVPVMCFGLRTDFRSRLFEGSKRLMELADSIEEVKTTCACCSKRLGKESV